MGHIRYLHGDAPVNWVAKLVEDFTTRFVGFVDEIWNQVDGFIHTPTNMTIYPLVNIQKTMENHHF